MLGQNASIAEDNQSVFCPGQCHVQSSGVIQEPNSRGLITAHARQQNEVFLTALKAVNGGHLNLLVKL